MNTTTERACSPSIIEAIDASDAGSLPGFRSVCSCGLVMTSTIRWNLEADVRDHVRYMAARGRHAFQPRKQRPTVCAICRGYVAAAIHAS